jgi:hypothetical protein
MLQSKDIGTPHRSSRNCDGEEDYADDYEDDDDYDDDDFEVNEGDDVGGMAASEVALLLPHASDKAMVRKERLRKLYDFIDTHYGNGNGTLSKKEIVRAANKNSVLRTALHGWMGLPETPISRSDLNDRDGALALAFRDLGSTCGKEEVNFEHFFGYFDVRICSGSDTSAEGIIREGCCFPETGGAEASNGWASRTIATSVITAQVPHPSGLLCPPRPRAKDGLQGSDDECTVHGATDDAILKTYLTRLVLGDMITELSVEERPFVTGARRNPSTRGFTESDFESRFYEKPLSPHRRAEELIGNFDHIYMHFIRSMSLATQEKGNLKGDTDEIEKAFADSLRQCFSDPSIISLLRRATLLRIRQ